MVCKASSSSPEPQTWREGGGSAGLCELRVRVNYILQWGPLLPSRKAGKRLGRPVRLPHSAEGCLDPGGCLHGARNPESHTWAPASAALSARWTCWGHTGAFTSDTQEGTKQEPGQDISSSTPTPTPETGVGWVSSALSISQGGNLPDT